MILYIIYKDKKKYVLAEFKLHEVPILTIATGIQLSTPETLVTLKEKEESTMITKGIDATTEPSESIVWMGTNGQDIFTSDIRYNLQWLYIYIYMYMIEKTKKLLLGSRGVIWQLNAKVVC